MFLCIINFFHRVIGPVDGSDKAVYILSYVNLVRNRNTNMGRIKVGQYWEKLRIGRVVLSVSQRQFSSYVNITVVNQRGVTHVEQKVLALPKHPSSPNVFSGVRVARFLVFCVLFSRSLFIIFFLALHCLSFDLRLLITPIVSSNFS